MFDLRYFWQQCRCVGQPFQCAVQLQYTKAAKWFPLVISCCDPLLLRSGVIVIAHLYLRGTGGPLLPCLRGTNAL
jgi:hypothetical protein